MVPRSMWAVRSQWTRAVGDGSGLRKTGFAGSLPCWRHVLGHSQDALAVHCFRRSASSSALFRPYQYTKYRITKTWSPDSDYEDLFLAEPSREDLAKSVKNEPVFLRFLKLVTDEEKRPEAFRDFVTRCESGGLVVEKDVYITKKELIQQLWDNGYSKLEMHAYEIAFPNDYRFHYPELAVLFNLPEEDCYTFCLRTRALGHVETNDDDRLVEVKHKHTPNALTSYGVLSSALWFGLQNNMLGNMWMMVKTWPFFAVFYMLASRFQKDIWQKIFSQPSAESMAALENRLEGEDAIYNQIRKYHNDSKCLEYVEAFKPAVERQLRQFAAALIRDLEANMVQEMTKHLIGIRQREKLLEDCLHSSMVNETARAFLDVFQGNSKMQDSALDAAIEALAVSHAEGDHGGQSRSKLAEVEDPVSRFFRDTFKAFKLRSTEEASGSQAPPLVQRIWDAFYQREQEFLNQFTVHPEEARFMQQLLKKAEKTSVSDVTSSSGNQARESKPGMYKKALDLSQLSNAEYESLNTLYNVITKRLGIASAFESPVGSRYTPAAAPSTSSSGELIEPLFQEVTQRIEEMRRNARTIELQSFLTAVSS